MTVRVPPSSPDHRSEVYTIDYRETAPALANASMYVKFPDSSRFGGLAVAVPGELRGLEEAHRRWGTLPWKRLVWPSVSLAEGWEVDKELGKRIPVRRPSYSSRRFHSSMLIQWFPDLMLNNPDWSAIFAPQGRFLREGEIIRRTNLSRTLASIAQEGADALYQVGIDPFAGSSSTQLRN
jgi:gamma-glutamyltranspeptidase / glutathione hydrolase / leukotriene-C4 hydrolase